MSAFPFNAATMLPRLLAAALGFCGAWLPSSSFACWQEVAEKYQVSAHLLYAIAKTESSLNPMAINRNANGSYDIGLMQINSTWFPTLLRFGITEKDLYRPCVSIEVAAWILAQNMQRHGATWAAVGAYNSPDAQRGLAYANRVYRNLPAVTRASAEGR
jgi:soluble lytic murein transglycosylase-like protein